MLRTKTENNSVRSGKHKTKKRIKKVSELHSVIYTTTKTMNEAKQIAKYLLVKRLVACANIFKINSVYRWAGKIKDDAEYGMILKTRKANIKKVINKIKEKHSYEVPCIISVPIANGNKQFLDWIAEETEI